MKVPLIYTRKPLFGIDIGTQTVKVAQVTRNGGKVRVVGYGFSAYPAHTMVEGIVFDPEGLAQTIKPLLANPSRGRITARRAAVSLPADKVFIRTLQLPPMSAKDLDQAIHFEAEQYIPVPVTDLYIDYEIIQQNAVGAEANQYILMVAVPKAIVNSYIKLFDALDLEVDSLEVSLVANTRAMLSVSKAERTTLLLDFGASSADLSIYDQVIRLTGTISIGGVDLTRTLMSKLGVSEQQAGEIKSRFGVGPSGMQDKVLAALEPQLKSIVAEIRRVIKYYRDRGAIQHEVTSIVLSGGSASMPGLVDFLQKELSMPITIGNPWQNLVTDPLPACPPQEQPMYATAIGLALRELEP